MPSTNYYLIAPLTADKKLPRDMHVRYRLPHVWLVYCSYRSTIQYKAVDCTFIGAPFADAVDALRAAREYNASYAPIIPVTPPAVVSAVREQAVQPLTAHSSTITTAQIRFVIERAIQATEENITGLGTSDFYQGMLTAYETVLNGISLIELVESRSNNS